jgi:hypothetical protein
MKASAVSATSRQPWSIVREWPRPAEATRRRRLRVAYGVDPKDAAVLFA